MPSLSDAELLRQTMLFFDIEQRRLLVQHGPLTQSRMLLILLRHGSLSQMELGRRLSLEKSWVSRAIDKLVELGWVERAQSQKDRRAFNLTLTEAGDARARMLRTEIDRHASHVLERLAPDEQAVVMQAMRLLDTVIERPEAPSATHG
ncbi:MAG: MarR family transcriptional regulator [Rhodocyclaceae bacterium]